MSLLDVFPPVLLTVSIANDETLPWHNIIYKKIYNVHGTLGIFQSDNGKEFKRNVKRFCQKKEIEMINIWILTKCNTRILSPSVRLQVGSQWRTWLTCKTKSKNIKESDCWVRLLWNVQRTVRCFWRLRFFPLPMIPQVTVTANSAPFTESSISSGFSTPQIH